MRQPVTETTFERGRTPTPSSPHPPIPAVNSRAASTAASRSRSTGTQHDNSTSVEIWQPATEETLLFTVAKKQALDAFHHPFAHLPITFDNLIPALDA